MGFLCFSSFSQIDFHTACTLWRCFLLFLWDHKASTLHLHRRVTGCWSRVLRLWQFWKCPLIPPFTFSVLSCYSRFRSVLLFVCLLPVQAGLHILTYLCDFFMGLFSGFYFFFLQPLFSSCDSYLHFDGLKRPSDSPFCFCFFVCNWRSEQMAQTSSEAALRRCRTVNIHSRTAWRACRPAGVPPWRGSWPHLVDWERAASWRVRPSADRAGLRIHVCLSITNDGNGRSPSPPWLPFQWVCIFNVVSVAASWDDQL